ncbi:hypothetical protein C5L31_000135 [Secundilactobacillus malefermentans]|uniref:HD Cas3-type domain-containing protein n=1 Tax=Secundilactobacillus malefermentans TaxID=176292 RepID=A0A4R5NS02_9LACO|nr:CRISPR-associated helicase/endonuclease Cas3 [Secundilactobacillus malefermentans]KRM56733.1 hypothetical protein FD44_GL001584 [Secundilactobacillus malefermentans DSM 5705 = KCTC 3548]TDG79339.1 hypothetical protein C5L31_000135 [Secundilactobacillus malefermentans]
MYIGHIGQDDDRIQELSTHLLSVRDMCYQWGKEIGLAHVCGLAGWLHDMGKYSDTFQDYIIKSHDNDPSAIRGSVDHATAGAIFLANYSQNPGELDEVLVELVGNVVMAHHNSKGALDYINPEVLDSPFTKRINKSNTDLIYSPQMIEASERFFSDFDTSEFSKYYQAAIDEIRPLENTIIQTQAFFLRYVLSTLIDADHTDTADFESNNTYKQTVQSSSILSHYFDINEEAVQTQIKENSTVSNPRTKKLNQLRQKMSDACYQTASEATGIYSLSVPTGGGKTLSSLRFALRKAKLQGIQRIIYVVPYTTIIEQNANAIRKRLNWNANDSANILEYHSTIMNEPKDPAYYYARDSWDSPIIITSQVAYLDALYGRGSKNIRHMHQLINSVIIFDEIQTLPLNCIELNNDAIQWLEQQNTTSLLCTATQPALEKLPHGLSIAKEIVPDLSFAQNAFKRVEIKPVFNEAQQLKVHSLSDLISLTEEQLHYQNSVLVILNTKKVVRAAYEALPEQPGLKKFHLSTSMCPKNRQDKFEEIKKQLDATKNSENNKVAVFATNLIEAGVDLSFECVIRSVAGIDSIVQAAGRCNRNNEVDLGKTFVVKMATDVEYIGGPLRLLKDKSDITDALIQKNHNQDLLADSVITDYFTRLYAEKRSELPYPVNTSKTEISLYPLICDLDKDPKKESIKAYVKKFGNLPPTLFSTAPNTVANYFRVIDSETTNVIVQYNTESIRLVSELISEKSKFENISKLLKKAQPYCVSVFGDPNNSRSALGQLLSTGDVQFYPEQGIYVAADNAYSKDLGLVGTGNFDYLDY